MVLLQAGPAPLHKKPAVGIGFLNVEGKYYLIKIKIIIIKKNHCYY